MSEHLPKRIELHTKSKELELFYEEGSYRLSAELLRVMSPSAEVQGHRPEEAVLQTGKRYVALVGAEPVGHYALKLVFDDGHDSGLFTWDYLYDLCVNKQFYWQEYIEQLRLENASREPESVATHDASIIATSSGFNTTRH